MAAARPGARDRPTADLAAVNQRPRLPALSAFDLRAASRPPGARAQMASTRPRSPIWG
jgi:hypothetical protein